MSPIEAREAMGRLGAIIGPGTEPARDEYLVVPTRAGDLRAQLISASLRPKGVIVYLHGGGWVVGEIEHFAPLCRELSSATDCAVISVGYRKAPENPYPGPVDDAWDALQWTSSSCHQLFDRDLPILIAGDSAGGNIAIAAAMRAATEKIAISGQILFYPVTDCGFDRPSYTSPDNELMLTRRTMQWYWDHYVPLSLRRLEAEASPLRAEDLSGLPPTILLAAEHDVLLDEGFAFANRLREANVPVIYEVVKSQMHAFLMMVDVLPGSAQGFEILRRAFQKLWPAIIERGAGRYVL